MTQKPHQRKLDALDLCVLEIDALNKERIGHKQAVKARKLAK